MYFQSQQEGYLINSYNKKNPDCPISKTERAKYREVFDKYTSIEQENELCDNDIDVREEDDHHGDDCSREISTYELDRLSNIARNKKMLRQLGLLKIN